VRIDARLTPVLATLCSISAGPPAANVSWTRRR
jgi:hypothetical protein